MGSGRHPICKKCGKQKSYAVMRYYTKAQAEKLGFCMCVYQEFNKV